jgi:hypothetical protein
MTQAFNLSQLANNLDSSGRLDATDGLVNALPVANGGTGASSAAAARTNLDVPTRTGGDASGTWAINITGSAATVATIATSQVLSAMSGASSKAVGTYIFAGIGAISSGTTTQPGAVFSGSSLSPASITFDLSFGDAWQGSLVGPSLTGSWMLMGAFPASGSGISVISLFLRIA